MFAGFYPFLAEKRCKKKIILRDVCGISQTSRRLSCNCCKILHVNPLITPFFLRNVCEIPQTSRRLLHSFFTKCLRDSANISQTCRGGIERFEIKKFLVVCF
uniref:Uncharacterized protein n=1 Tax=Drosophila-associated filamentous virus TaxID=2743186 RepID=A0A6M9TZX5_9VIRU|nr:putative protein 26 [Drosophila-associated filamentous virus]